LTDAISNYPVPEVMNELGFGMRPDQLDVTMVESLQASWGCAPWLIAESLGVELDEIRLDTDLYLSPRTFTAPGGTRIEAGTIGATRWTMTGVIEGQPRIMINHVNRMGGDMAPSGPASEKRADTASNSMQLRPTTVTSRSVNPEEPVPHWTTRSS
jgi:2,4-diaminopentanoate dehydrogenase